MPKQARLSGIKSLFPYTLEEAAEVSGVSLRTIRNWVADGLHIMDGARPTLIRGDALRDYIKKQRTSRKVKTEPDSFYCVRCRMATKAAEGMADCTIEGRRAKLTAICERCETIVSKPIAQRIIPEIAKKLDLTIERREATLKG